ncbi:MAG TPA: hypothetical protein VNO33_01690 [Kofleriaceae bacterium]|nr:hypothetical protein [Kofleriaceae bacterium]
MKRFSLLALTLSLAACGSDDPAEESIDVEGCEHLSEGPAVAVTAGATPEEAPGVADDHMRYDVTLVPVDGGNGGTVAFDSAEAADFVFFLGADVALGITDSGAQAVTIEESATSSPECVEIRGRHVAELTVGTHYLSLGPTAEESVSLVIEHAAGHEEHEGE